MRTFTPFGEKNFVFFLKLMVCPHGQGKGKGVESVRIFFGQEEKVVNFSRFCADVLYGRPLMNKMQRVY